MPSLFGGQSMVTRLRRVLVKRPDAVMAGADPQRWHYAGKINLPEAVRDHETLVEILRQHAVEVLYHDKIQPGRADAVFVFDPVLMTDAGAVILRMGKELRQGEEDAMAHKLEQLGIPVIGRLGPGATAEGGDLMWLDRHTLAVGQGFRTNPEGLRQLQAILAPMGVGVVPVSLPYYHGPEACLHLMTPISLLDENLAVAYPPLLPAVFVQVLEQRGIRILPVPEDEFATMATNVLAIQPRVCLMVDGNPVTQARLEAAGCRVHVYRGGEISLKTEGGPTCLTLPLLRRA